MTGAEHQSRHPRRRFYLQRRGKGASRRVLVAPAAAVAAAAAGLPDPSGFVFDWSSKQVWAMAGSDDVRRRRAPARDGLLISRTDHSRALVFCLGRKAPEPLLFLCTALIMKLQQLKAGSSTSSVAQARAAGPAPARRPQTACRPTSSTVARAAETGKLRRPGPPMLGTRWPQQRRPCPDSDLCISRWRCSRQWRWGSPAAAASAGAGRGGEGQWRVGGNDLPERGSLS
eukprot:363650-Chlamydomonas_euryale.AAC.2